MNPNLIERESRYVLNASLAEMHKRRVEWYYVIFNIGICIGVVCILIWMWHRQQSYKLTESERKEQDEENKKKILAKINEIQYQHAVEKAKAQQETLITQLPLYEPVHNYPPNKV